MGYLEACKWNCHFISPILFSNVPMLLRFLGYLRIALRLESPLTRHYSCSVDSRCLLVRQPVSFLRTCDLIGEPVLRFLTCEESPIKECFEWFNDMWSVSFQLFIAHHRFGSTISLSFSCKGPDEPKVLPLSLVCWLTLFQLIEWVPKKMVISHIRPLLH